MEQQGGIDLGAVLRGLGSGAIVALGALLLCTGLLYLTSEPAGLMGISATAIAWVAIIAAGLAAARRAGHAGALHGALAGAAVFACLLGLGTLIFDVPLNLGPAGLRLVGAALAGGVGGAIGLML